MTKNIMKNNYTLLHIDIVVTFFIIILLIEILIPLNGAARVIANTKTFLVLFEYIKINKFNNRCYRLYSAAV
jgi:hypothetical protein